MSLPTLQGEFRLVDDPELKFAPSGTPYARVRLVANSRKKQGDEWVDDKVLWMNGTAFNKVAENIAHSLQKGQLVLVTGRVQTETWTTEGGENRSATALMIDEIGPSLKWDNAILEKAERKQQGQPAAQQSTGESPWSGPPQSEEPPY